MPPSIDDKNGKCGTMMESHFSNELNENYLNSIAVCANSETSCWIRVMPMLPARLVVIRCSTP